MSDATHTPWSEPGAHRARLSDLGDTPSRIADALEEFTIHHDIARQLGFGVPAAAEGDRGLRHAERLLGAVLERDARPLTEHRALADYLYVTCRDFDLLAVAALRERGVPARLRAGFAAYFSAGLWMDHWVCEYARDGGWARLDAQLGPRAREGMKITFPIDAVPEALFRPAAWIWRAHRAGEVDAAHCGLPSAGISGPCWLATSVLRDAAALAGIEALPWDTWGMGVSIKAARGVTPEHATRIDELAAALDSTPPDRDSAKALLARFPWAMPDAAERAMLEGQAHG